MEAVKFFLEEHPVRSLGILFIGLFFLFILAINSRIKFSSPDNDGDRSKIFNIEIITETTSILISVLLWIIGINIMNRIF
jgi:hypothetical protein